MTGVILFGDIYLPAVIVLAFPAFLFTLVIARLLRTQRAYRLKALRPFVNIAIYIFVLALLSVLLGGPPEAHRARGFASAAEPQRGPAPNIAEKP